jgi:hypothetical protein
LITVSATAPTPSPSSTPLILDGARRGRTPLKPSEVAFAITSSGSVTQVSLMKKLWAPYIKKGFRVSVYGGGQTFHVPGLDVINFMQLPMNEYPPLTLNFHIWDHMTKQSELSWYVRCDSDSFVNAPQLMQILSNLDPTEAWYTGTPVEGAPQTPKHFFFAQGGGCEIISKVAAQRVRSKLFDCMAWSRANLKPPIHSDVEFARCLQLVGIRFRRIPGAHNYSTVFSNSMALEKTGQLVGLQPSDLKGVVNRSYAVIHPVKDPRLMMLLRDIEVRGLTPFMDNEVPPTSCLHNPQVVQRGSQQQKIASPLPECQLRYMANLSGSEGVFLSLDPAKAQRGSEAMARIIPDVTFKGLVGIPGQPQYYIPLPGLTSGEMAHRQVFRKLLQESDPSKNVLRFAFDDDVMLHHNFSELWKDIMLSDRCTGFLSEPGGVLLLGASQYGSWKPIDLQEQKKCYNADNRTRGSFAFVYSHQISDTALEWLDNSNKPFDHLWEYLVQRGFPVRVARPNLFIAQTSDMDMLPNKTSAVTPDRLDRLGWQVEHYTSVI